MNIKRIVFASLFCIAVLLCAGKKAEAAFPYDMEQKPVTATSIQDGKVAVYSDENLKNKKEEVAGNNLTIEAYKWYLRQLQKWKKIWYRMAFS